MKKELVAFIVSILLALAMAAIAWWGFFNTSDNLFIVYLVSSAIWVFNATLAWRIYGRNRRANRNSGSTGPGGGTIHGTITYSPIIPQSSLTAYTLARPYSWYMGAGEGTSLKKVDEPFRAWKWAILAREYPTERGKIVFTPLNEHHPKYGAVDIAQCGSINWHYATTEEDRRALRHRVGDPAFPCSCGFYGYKERWRAMEMVPALHTMWRVYEPDEVVLYVLLEVDFYGRVIVHTDGYRAEKQRVLAMHVPDTQKGHWWYEMHGGQPEVEWQWWKLPPAYTDYKEGTF